MRKEYGWRNQRKPLFYLQKNNPFSYLHKSGDCCKPGLQLGGQPLRIVAIQGNFQIQPPGEKCCHFQLHSVITALTTKVDTKKKLRSFLLELTIDFKLHNNCAITKFILWLIYGQTSPVRNYFKTQNWISFALEESSHPFS